MSGITGLTSVPNNTSNKIESLILFPKRLMWIKKNYVYLQMKVKIFKQGDILMNEK